MQSIPLQMVDYLPSERQQWILERLGSSGRVIAQELAREFQTSEDTIRRDLRELAAAGLCQRVYGGALPLSPASSSMQMRRQQGGKEKLGQTLASLIKPGQVVFIDAGSTHLAVIEALPDDLAFTLITNAPAIAALAAERPAIELIVIGGKFDRHSGATLGICALRDIAALRPDLYLLGLCALDADAGIACFSLEEAEFRRSLLSHSRRIVGAISNEKLATSAPFYLADCEVLETLVVEADAPASILASLAAKGIHILHAQT